MTRDHGYARVGGLLVHQSLKKVVESEIMPGTGINSTSFWSSMEKLLRDFAPENEALLRKRDSIQAQIDAWCLGHRGAKFDASAYTAFLGNIGYIVPEGPDFKVETQNVDREISSIPGPQLVVPVDKPRFALNAANARWGSLLDAFYGTDAGPPETDGATKKGPYNPIRGARVFDYAHAFLDEHFALEGAKYNDVKEFRVANKALQAVLKDNRSVSLKNAAQFVGFSQKNSTLSNVLLRNNGLHCDIQIDPTNSVGRTHAAGVKDVVLESALTAIADFEDSVAAVDAEDKAVVYRNWAGLMNGSLKEKFSKDGKVVERTLHADKTFTCPKSGKDFVLPGRVVLLVRNVGLHMYTDAVRFADTNQDVPEGLVDAMVSTLGFLHDFKKPKDAVKNSRAGSMYMVKPKQHGPEEVAFTVRSLCRVEDALGLPRNTIKLGIMDEERRTTVNLKECIREAKNRCIFINTGFLDRTGDEIHTSFRLGPVVPKSSIKKALWKNAYEDWNVDIGIETGFFGRAQIGKGMWAAPGSMADMLRIKGEHPESGANTAWVPSPTAATLHAIHYHKIDVLKIQKKLLEGGRRAKLADILVPPILDRKLTSEEIQVELEDNLQGILGYIVRWINIGVGCSTVPDIHNVGLMEDRATLRISSQLVANWLYWGIVTKEQVLQAFEKMAVVVDRQNAGAGYVPMAPAFTSFGYKCALEMVFSGMDAPNGLTEWTLTKYRRLEKAKHQSSRL